MFQHTFASSHASRFLVRSILQTGSSTFRGSSSAANLARAFDLWIPNGLEHYGINVQPPEFPTSSNNGGVERQRRGAVSSTDVYGTKCRLFLSPFPPKEGKLYTGLRRYRVVDVSHDFLANLVLGREHQEITQATLKASVFDLAR